MAAAVRQFQFVQTSVDKLEVHLVAERVLSADEKDDLQNLWARMTGFRFTFDVIYHDATLPRDAGTKFEDFKSLIGQ